MGKIDAVKIEQGENSYSEAIPLGGFAEYITYNDNYSLLDILGTGFNLGPNTRGNIKQQLDTLFENNNLEVLHSQITEEIDEKADEVTTQINSRFNYITPEMFGAKGDGNTDDSDSLQLALNDGRPVIGIGTYKITKTLFVNNAFQCNANSKILLDFNGSFGVVIGGSQLNWDGTSYLFDVNIVVDCNNKSFSNACVALNAIKRSNIILRGINCTGTFYKDVYGDNGSNFENYIDINASGTGAIGSICAILHSSDNNYNQICCCDFETCVQFDTSSSQNINCIHGWLSTRSQSLWENSTLIRVVKGSSNAAIMPRLAFNFIYQDTMRYGFYVGENRIEAYGQFWFSAVNASVIPVEMRSTDAETYPNAKPIISFYGTNINTPSFIRADFHEFFDAPFSFNDKRALILEGGINPQRMGLNFAFTNLNNVPMGTRTAPVNLIDSSSNGPEGITGEATLIQHNSLRYVIQIIITATEEIYFRKKGTWAPDTSNSSNSNHGQNHWTPWNKIYPIEVPIIPDDFRHISYGIDDPDPNQGNVGDIYLKIIDIQ